MPTAADYASKSAGMRETSKWIAAAFTGAGAFLFSALSFTSLQQIPRGTGWGVILSLAVIPVAMAALVVFIAARVITMKPPIIPNLLPNFAAKTVGSPVSHDAELTSEVEALLPAVVGVYGSIQGYEERLQVASDAARRRSAAYLKSQRVEDQEARDKAYVTLDSLQSGVQDLLSCAEYIRVRKAYQLAGWVFLGAAVVAVASISAAGILMAQATAAAPVAAAKSATVTAPAAVRVWIPGPIDHRVAGPQGCPIWDGMDAKALGGTFEQPLLIFSGEVPDSRFRFSAADRGKCTEPWSWAPASGELIVYPVTE